MATEQLEKETGHDDGRMDRETSARLRAIWKQAYAAKTKDDLRRLYEEWAPTYDRDHEAIGFFGHERAAEIVARYTSFANVAAVLDAGAGTGAAGEALAQRGFKNLTAVDLSAEMLEVARDKGVYRKLVQADLGQPLDAFPTNHFDAAVLVGVFSYGQAPAHALDEMARVVKPGGVVVFTMRTDFYGEDAMGVRTRMEALEESGTWLVAEVSDPEPYLPRKDPDARFRIWCCRVVRSPRSELDTELAEAATSALAASGRVKRIDHCHIWNSLASRLYDAYTECPEYYLTDCEEQILQAHGEQIAGSEERLVELGCGSARKISHVLAAVLDSRERPSVTYTPIDLSRGALEATQNEIEETFGDQVKVEPIQGHFNEVIPELPENERKAIFFFGSSIGNIETVEETLGFLEMVRGLMTPRDRFLVGVDLDKDPEVLLAAYTAGPRNHSFFLNMLRRINNELGGNLDLGAFEQESTYDAEEPYRGVDSWCVNLRLRATREQEIYLRNLDFEARLEAGDAIQVGASRKYRLHSFGRLCGLAGFTVTHQFLDRLDYYSLNEARVSATSPPAA